MIDLLEDGRAIGRWWSYWKMIEVLKMIELLEDWVGYWKMVELRKMVELSENDRAIGRRGKLLEDGRAIGRW